ncbi:hypothetical protein GQ42DRAFT_77392 [Ramicandelaber brevisporus]|nr:hypothetical protein GQ42DRAFT_77392 [Ramicandelaber brevisporus]
MHIVDSESNRTRGVIQNESSLSLLSGINSLSSTLLHSPFCFFFFLPLLPLQRLSWHLLTTLSDMSPSPLLLLLLLSQTINLVSVSLSLSLSYLLALSRSCIHHHHYILLPIHIRIAKRN